MAEHEPPISVLLRQLARRAVRKARRTIRRVPPPAAGSTSAPTPAPDDPSAYKDGWGNPTWWSQGQGTYCHGRAVIHVYPYETNRVDIGSFTSIADGCEFMVGGNHAIDRVTTWPVRESLGLPGAWRDGFPWSRGDIKVGSDVWLGRGVKVLSGVTIGDGAVVGAYSVVTRDVRPYAIATGVPAREIRRRFDDDIVDRLLALRWWDWPLEKIREVGADLYWQDLEAFLDKYEDDEPT